MSRPGATLPLIAWAYAGFAAGLIAGFAGGPLALLGGATLLGWCAYHQSSSSAGVLLLFAGGVAVAHSDRVPIRPPTTAVERTCLAGDGRGATEPPLENSGARRPGRDTLNRTRPGFLARERLRAGCAIDSLFSEDAPLARALLIADQTEIPKPVRDRYAAAGIVHMLSISGLHVAIIAAVVELLLHLARLPRGIATAAAVAVTALYVAIIGSPPPAVRAGAMLGVIAASRVLQRPTSPWASLAIGGSLPLCIDPRTVLDIGYQLSVGGIAGLIASRALARRLIDPHCSGWRRRTAHLLLTSAVATTVSAPLVAWSFGRVSVIAPLTNLIADPVLGLAQPMLFLALVLAPVHPVARLFATASHPLLAAFDTVAAWGAAIPGGSLPVHPTPLAALLAGLAAVASVVACVSRFPARPALLAAGALCALTWLA